MKSMFKKLIKKIKIIYIIFFHFNKLIRSLIVNKNNNAYLNKISLFMSDYIYDQRRFIIKKRLKIIVF